MKSTSLGVQVRHQAVGNCREILLRLLGWYGPERRSDDDNPCGTGNLDYSLQQMLPT